MGSDPSPPPGALLRLEALGQHLERRARKEPMVSGVAQLRSEAGLVMTPRAPQ
jgi:hypothetical protein